MGTKDVNEDSGLSLFCFQVFGLKYCEFQATVPCKILEILYNVQYKKYVGGGRLSRMLVSLNQ